MSVGLMGGSRSVKFVKALRSMLVFRRSSSLKKRFRSFGVYLETSLLFSSALAFRLLASSSRTRLALASFSRLLASLYRWILCSRVGASGRDMVVVLAPQGRLSSLPSELSLQPQVLVGWGLGKTVGIERNSPTMSSSLELLLDQQRNSLRARRRLSSRIVDVWWDLERLASPNQQRSSLRERRRESGGLSGSGSGPRGQIVRISRKFRQRRERKGV